MSYNRPFLPILAAFGLTRTQKLPVDGAPRRYVDGVAYWINPLPLGPVRHKRSTHRVMCECPVCGKTLSAGRLPQHKFTNACINAMPVDQCDDCGEQHPTGDMGCQFPRDREDFHSDEGIRSADDEPFFPDA